MSRATEERDDIGRMIELNSRFEPAPGSAFKETLAELRRRHSPAEPASRRIKSGWNRVVVGGLGLVAGLAVIFITLSLLAVFDKPAAPPPSPVAQVATATATPVPPATTTTIGVAAATIETTSPDTPTTTTSTPPAASPTAVSTAAALPSPVEPTQLPPTATAINTPRSSLTTPGRPQATMASAGSNKTPAGFYSVSGTVTAFNQSGNLLQITDVSGKPVSVRLTSATVIIRKGLPVKASDIAVGDKLTVSGKLNAQGQFEATSIALDIVIQPRPVGDPGYPDDTK